ncbi:MAG: SRPBCC family protein [Pseudomonadota bacterium]
MPTAPCSVFENRCAHRGARVLQDPIAAMPSASPARTINGATTLTGALVAVPFRRGVHGKGGMPASFDMAAQRAAPPDRRLPPRRRVRDVLRRGAGARRLSGSGAVRRARRHLQGPRGAGARPASQSAAVNWKLYQENLKDPYHATLLHTYLTTFGLFVAGNRTAVVVDRRGQAQRAAQRPAAGRPADDETKRDIGSFRAGLTLADPRVLEFVEEFDADWTSCAMTIWPNLSLLRQLNILNLRQLVPQGPHGLLLIWTSFGYVDDDAAMTQHRLRQNNIFGPRRLPRHRRQRGAEIRPGRAAPGGAASRPGATRRRRGGPRDRDHRPRDPRHVPPLPPLDGALRRCRGATPHLQALRFAVEDFHCLYADVLDRGEVESWPASSPRTRSIA